MSDAKPRISVIMPINRDDGFFEAALNSVLCQSYRNFEFLIIANNCSDELWQKISDISDERVVAKRVNIGNLIFPMNLGLSLAKGEYIARMDADDVCLPDRFKLQLNFLEKNPNIDILGGRVKLIDSFGSELSTIPKFFETHFEITSALPYRNPLVQPAIFFRKKVLLENGGYKFGFAGEDYDLWIRLMLAGKTFHNLNDVVLLYRRHESQMTSDNRRYLIFSEVSALLLMYFLKTKDVRFLLGAILKIPFLRRVRDFLTKDKD
jgi:glycosyltransferase involved in cell wall biosynthesis